MNLEEVEKKDISIVDFADTLNLITKYDGEGKEIRLCTVSVNRPGLLLAGFDKYFGDNRVQVLGSAEVQYLATLELEERYRVLNILFAYKVPCLIICRGIIVPDELIEVAKIYQKPIFISQQITSNLINDLVMFLNDFLAPVATVHGVLLDVHGVGILLTGKSGIGKSETALELIKRGHRLVADDAVIVKNVKNIITGTAPELIRFFMEIRGIGIIDIRRMYGVGSIAYEMKVELVIDLEDWNEKKQYDRLGLNQEYAEILNQKIPKILVPVRPGRNLAIITEIAARNHRLKESGYNAAAEINKRLSGDN